MIPFLYKRGKKRCLNTAVGVIAFLDPWKKAQEKRHPGVHLGTSLC